MPVRALLGSTANKTLFKHEVIAFTLLNGFIFFFLLVRGQSCTISRLNRRTANRQEVSVAVGQPTTATTRAQTPGQTSSGLARPEGTTTVRVEFNRLLNGERRRGGLTPKVRGRIADQQPGPGLGYVRPSVIDE